MIKKYFKKIDPWLFPLWILSQLIHRFIWTSEWVSFISITLLTLCAYSMAINEKQDKYPAWNIILYIISIGCTFAWFEQIYELIWQ